MKFKSKNFTLKSFEEASPKHLGDLRACDFLVSIFPFCVPFWTTFAGHAMRLPGSTLWRRKFLLLQKRFPFLGYSPRMPVNFGLLWVSLTKLFYNWKSFSEKLWNGLAAKYDSWDFIFSRSNRSKLANGAKLDQTYCSTGLSRTSII